MGRFAGSRDRSRDDASRVEQSPRVPVPPRLERDESDPRWVLLEVLHDAGLSFAYHAPVPVETLFSRVMAAAPRLAGSTPRGQSPFAMLNQGVAWTLVDDGRSSAVILSTSIPSATDDREARKIIDDLMNNVIFVLDKAGLVKDVLVEGAKSITPGLADLLQRGEVVAPWEVPGQQVLPRPADWTTLPITVHRAAKGWERVTSYLYRKAFDVDGTIITVHLGLIDRQPRLACTFDSQPDGNLDEYGWVTASGEHTLWWFNPAVAACTRIPADIDASALTTLSRELIDFIGFLGIDKPSPTLRRRTTGSIWSVVESPPPGAKPAATFHWRGVGPEDYLSCESVRHAVSGAGFDEVEGAARRLLASWGSGFAGTLRRGPDTERMSPDWLAVNAATFDPDTGRLVLVGHPNHHLLGLPPAYDLGMIDGRNAFAFKEAGHPDGLAWPCDHLYIGSTRTGALIPLSYSENVISADYDPATEAIGCLEFLGGVIGAVTITDQDGERHVLTTLEPISGNEPVRFSPDGAWLLIPRPQQTYVVETATGRWLTLDIPNATWWPLADSTLLTVTHHDGRISPRLHDLASNSVTGTFPDITISGLLPKFPYLWSPDVSTDGRFLVGTAVTGVSAEFQDKHGAGSRPVRVDLATGEAYVGGPTFLDTAHTLERHARHVTIPGKPAPRAVHLHPELATQLQDPITSSEYLTPNRWADDSIQFVGKLLNRAIDGLDAGEDPAPLLPDLVAAMSALRRDPDAWARLEEWLTGVQRGIQTRLHRGDITDPAAHHSWQAFGTAFTALQSEGPDATSPLDVAWRTPTPQPVPPSPPPPTNPPPPNPSHDVVHPASLVPPVAPTRPPTPPPPPPGAPPHVVHPASNHPAPRHSSPTPPATVRARTSPRPVAPSQPSRTRTALLTGALLLIAAITVFGIIALTRSTEPNTANSRNTDTPSETTSGTAPPCDLNQATIRASRTASDGVDAAGTAISYAAPNLTDGTESTAWRTPGDGVGEQITITFPAPCTLAELRVLNGYLKIDPNDGTDRWLQNRRVTRIEWSLGDLRLTHRLDPTSKDWQSTTIEPTVVSSVTGTILGSDPQTTDRDFTAISEISIR